MKKNTILNTILLIFIIIILLLNVVIIPNLVVDANTIEKFTNSYLDEYMKIVDDFFGHNYGYYFSFYEERPFNIKSIKSNKNGIAIIELSRLFFGVNRKCLHPQEKRKL